LPERVGHPSVGDERSRIPTLAAAEREADFYNVRENRRKIYERDNYHGTY
jgi:hypothetical protein